VSVHALELLQEEVVEDGLARRVEQDAEPDAAVAGGPGERRADAEYEDGRHEDEGEAAVRNEEGSEYSARVAG